jgi:methionyl-tRNA formyltransferase
MKIIFFGTPDFAANVLTDLLQNGLHVVAVVSKPDRPKGRSLTLLPTPVKTAALAFDASIPVYQPESAADPAFTEMLRAYQADLFVVVAYGEIMKQHLLDMPPLGCINLHASLLPKYRGAAPIQRCIINGEVESGVTIMHMVKKMDAGDMIEVATVPITPEMTFGELDQALCEIGKKTLLQVIRDFEVGVFNRVPQDPALVTFAPKIELEDCEIDWREPAEKLHNLIRGVNPLPGAWCYVQVKGEKRRLKVFRSRVISRFSETPGLILSGPKENIILATGGRALELLEVQLEGKKAMASKELIQGVSLNDLFFPLGLV